jgi:hypothetical protein
MRQKSRATSTVNSHRPTAPDAARDVDAHEVEEG